MSASMIEDLMPGLQLALETGDRARFWALLQSLEKRGELALERAGERLGEAAGRRAIELLTGGEPVLPIRPLMLPLALLGRTRESTAALVLHHLRHWRSSAQGEAPLELYLALGRCQASRAVEVLLEAKVYGTSAAREGVAAGLGQVSPQHPAFVEARLLLAELLLNDPVLSVRQAAAQALQLHFSDRDQPALLRLSLETDPSLRALLKTLWARKQVVAALGSERQGASERGGGAERQGAERVLRYFVRTLHPGGRVQFFKEFETPGIPWVPEGQEDREPVEPFYTASTAAPEGRTLLTLYDGTLMVRGVDGSSSFTLGRADWRTRNPATGVVTIRVPVDRPLEPRGTLTWRPDGILRLRLEDGSLEEEHPDGRRILVSPLGVVQIVSPRAEQGIQTDIHPELLERQTAHAFVLLEQASGAFELYGGEAMPLPLPEGTRTAVKLPFGAIRLEYRDGRITRELMTGESSHELLGGRLLSLVPRRAPAVVVGLKTYYPDGRVELQYRDGTVQRWGVGERPRYQLPDGSGVP